MHTPLRASCGAHVRLILGACLTLAFAVLAAAAEATKSFDIQSGDAAVTLKAFSEQSGLSIMFSPDQVKGVETKPVHGDLPPQAALDRLLADTPLYATPTKTPGAFSVRRETKAGEAEKNGNRAIAQDSGRPSKAKSKSDSDAPEGVIKLDTFEVMGSKLLNMDIKRTPNDVQPYVVFDRQSIDQSGALNLEDFFKTRLPMNSQGQTNSQTSAQLGNVSQVNLRGLGTNQTLILIDGRRAASSYFNGLPRQADLNGLPTGIIERIEVLPTTASGIYGSSAVGGVINIVLRRDYNGAELKLTYENTFERDAAARRADLSAGFNLEGGKTNVLLALSVSDANSLAVQDRDFLQIGRANLMANNPGSILNAAPLLGSTTNIRSSSGVNLTLKSGAALNSPITFVPIGYAGVASDNGAALVANSGHYNLLLAPTAQSSGGGKTGLFNGPRILSGIFTVRRQFTPRLQLFMDLAVADNTGRFPATAPWSSSFTIPVAAATNPFNQAISVRVPIATGDGTTVSWNTDQRATFGGILKVSADWMTALDLTWNRHRFGFRTAQNIFPSTAITTGTFDVIRDTSAVDFTPFAAPPDQTFTPFFATERIATARASGRLLDLPAGPLVLSLSGEMRDEQYSESTWTQLGTASYYPSRRQSVNSGYAEFRLPLVSLAQQLPVVQAAELQLAGRTEDYVVNGVTGLFAVTSPQPIVRVKNRNQSTNPTIGAKVELIGGFILRGSYGTGFLPPAVNQLVPNAGTFTNSGLVDPRRGNEVTGTIPFINGGNSSLRPEKSKSWSSGIVFTPSGLPHLRLSLDYTRIDKRDNITGTPGQQFIIDNEAFFPGRVTRGPVPAGDSFGVGPITFIDSTAVNVATAKMEAWDAQADYALKLSDWRLALFAAATWTPHYETRTVATAPVVENAGVAANPLRFRMNGGLSANCGAWTFGWNFRYFDSYLVANPATAAAATVFLNQGGRTVAGQTYHDVFVSYKGARRAAGGAWARLWQNWEIEGGVKNVFNSRPPYDASNTAAYYSWFGDPRLGSYYLSIKRAF